MVYIYIAISRIIKRFHKSYFNRDHEITKIVKIFYYENLEPCETAYCIVPAVASEVTSLVHNDTINDTAVEQ